MSDSTPRQAMGLLADGQELDAMQINDALVQFDAMTDICLLGQFVNTPPASSTDGDMYLLGAAPTGVWTGQAYKIAYCLDGGWRFYAPFNGLRAYVAATHGFLVYMGGAWTDANALTSANEVSIASAATCDLGAAGSLFLSVTGSTAITSFGTALNLMRFVRFAGALTLTHNATSLSLLGGASRVTAAGDSGLYRSDASGNWRELSYARATGVPGFIASRNGVDQTGLTANASNKVAFGTVIRNDGGYYDGATNYRFTPPPGVYEVKLGVNAGTGTSGQTCQAMIYKNGSLAFQGPYMQQSTAYNFRSTFSVNIVLNGSDYIEAYAILPAGVTTLAGAADSTYFSAYKVRDL